MDIRGACLRAIVVCAFVPESVVAFESNEHEKLGNLSLLVALDYFKAHAKEFPQRADAYDLAQELVGEVDKYDKYKRYTEEERKKVSYGDVIACVDYYLYPEKLLNLLQRRDTQPFDLSSCRGIFGSSFMQASHTNHSHFRNGALRSYRVRHTAAIKAAEDQEQIRYALLVNATADHYLHDLFAPGHIFTRRDDLSDTFATAVHDRYNSNRDEPIRFKPRFGNLKDLIPSLCEPSKPACILPTKLRLLAGHATPEQIADALKHLEDDASILPKGDDFLWENDGEQLKQRLLIVLVGARSILDVLTGQDSFAGMQWQETNDVPTTANLAYGEYDLAGVATTPGAVAPDFTTYPVIGVSYNREAMFSEGRAGRHVWSIETPLGFDIFGRRLGKGGENSVIAPMVGWTYYHEGSVNGQGPTIRFAVVKPETEFVYGPYFRWLSYPNGAERTRKLSLGGRIDSGFSSYFTFFLALGYDYGTAPDGSFSKGWLGSAGAEVLLPLNRIGSSVKSVFKGSE